MNPLPDVYTRLERVKTLWAALSKTPTKSKAYQVLADEIRAEAAAYVAGIKAVTAVDRRRKRADRRQRVDPTERRDERRQRERRG
jgi:hypothetical protein